MWHVGIDEAGYGPPLGPLVVTAAAVRCPDGGDPWAALGASVSPDPSGPGIPVCDSKRLHRPAAGPARVEGTALPFLHASGNAAAGSRYGRMRERVTGDEGWADGEGPWYRGDDPGLPLALAPNEAARRTAVLTAAVREAGAEVRLRSRVLDPARFNRDVVRFGNKARVLWAATADLLRETLDATEGETAVVVDRHGGRKFYGPLLRDSLPGVRVETRRETGARSGYRFENGRCGGTIDFAVRGDATAFATSLASVVSKYVREVSLHVFNGFWADRVPGLRPTAGYPTDARRFLRDIEPARRRERVPLDVLVRTR